jgi:uncharacterized protein (DUF488 family)
VIYTIGHSTRTYKELVAILQAWQVTTLVDIRRFARSRTNPQFNEPALRRRLPRDGIAYRALPDLAGRRGKTKGADPVRNAGWRVTAFKNYADYAETPPFANALSELLAIAAESTCAVMCAEAVWWRCHRRIVADYVITRGTRVRHIFSETRSDLATRTPFARVDRRTRTLRYPLVDT